MRVSDGSDISREKAGLEAVPEAVELNSQEDLAEIERIQDVQVMVRTGSNPGPIPVDNEGFDDGNNSSSDESKFGS